MKKVNKIKFKKKKTDKVRKNTLFLPKKKAFKKIIVCNIKIKGIRYSISIYLPTTSTIMV